jgi:hypothetical protein
MNTEFNSILDDDSDIQIAKLLIGYNGLYRDGQIGELAAELTKRFPSNKHSSAQSSVKLKQNEDEEVNIDAYRSA